RALDLEGFSDADGQDTTKASLAFLSGGDGRISADDLDAFQTEQLDPRIAAGAKKREIAELTQMVFTADEFGYTGSPVEAAVKEILGDEESITVEDFMKYVHPTSQPTVKAMLKGIVKTAERGKVRDGSYAINEATLTQLLERVLDRLVRQSASASVRGKIHLESDYEFAVADVTDDEGKGLLEVLEEGTTEKTEKKGKKAKKKGKKGDSGRTEIAMKMLEARRSATGGLYGDAIKKLEELLDDHPGDEEIITALIEILKDKAKSSLAADNPAEAVEVLRKARKKAPSDRTIGELIRRAINQLESKDQAAAIRILDELIEETEDDEDQETRRDFIIQKAQILIARTSGRVEYLEGTALQQEDDTTFTQTEAGIREQAQGVAEAIKLAIPGLTTEIAAATTDRDKEIRLAAQKRRLEDFAAFYPDSIENGIKGVHLLATGADAVEIVTMPDTTTNGPTLDTATKGQKKTIAKKDTPLTWTKRILVTGSDGRTKVAWYYVTGKTKKDGEIKGWVKVADTKGCSEMLRINKAITHIAGLMSNDEYTKAKEYFKTLTGIDFDDWASEKDTIKSDKLRDVYDKIHEAIESRNIAGLKAIGFGDEWVTLESAKEDGRKEGKAAIDGEKDDKKSKTTLKKFGPGTNDGFRSESDAKDAKGAISLSGCTFEPTEEKKKIEGLPFTKIRVTSPSDKKGIYWVLTSSVEGAGSP
ncbi:MAG: tetratricopeptide repeat protein, partial [bacterium]